MITALDKPHYKAGEAVMLHSLHGRQPIIVHMCSGYLMVDLTGENYVYEVIFPDGQKYAVLAEKITPLLEEYKP